MIQTKTLTRDDGATLIRTYSDAGYMIRQIETGVLYSEAVDITPCPYTYEETNIPIPAPDPPDDLEQTAQYLLD